MKKIYTRGDEKIDYIKDKMFNKKISEIYPIYKDLEGYDTPYLTDKNYKLNNDFNESYINTVDRIMSKALSKIDEKTLDEKLVKHFLDKGYDAAVDPNDSSGFSDYPVIILNPKNSVKRTAHNYRW